MAQATLPWAFPGLTTEEFHQNFKNLINCDLTRDLLIVEEVTILWLISAFPGRTPRLSLSDFFRWRTHESINLRQRRPRTDAELGFRQNP